MQKETFICAFIIALSFLHGCGSSSSDSSPKVETPKGVWKGTWQQTGSSFGMFGMVSPNGDTIFIPGVAPFNNDAQYTTGNLVADIESGAIDDTMILVVGSGLSPLSFHLQATFQPRSSIAGSLTRLPSLTRTIDLQWDPLSDRTASLGMVAGVWSDLRGGTSRTLTITSNGQLSGSDSSGCVYAGQVRVVKSNTNVYDLTMDISGCYNFSIHFNGLATLLDTSTTADTFLFAAVGFTPFGFSKIGVMDRQ